MNEIGRPEIGRPRGGKRSPYRRGAQLLLVGLVALAAYTIRAANAAGDDPCTPPVQNPIVCENSKPGNPPSEWDVSGAGDCQHPGLRHRHQRRPGPDRPLQGRHERDRLPPRHLPDGLLRRRRRAQGGDGPAVGEPAAEPARVPQRRQHRARRLRQLGRVGLLGGAGGRRLGHLLRQARARGRDAGGEPHLLRRPRRRRPLGPPLPDLRHDLAGLQPVRRQQPLRGWPGNQSRPRLQGQLQPAVHDPRSHPRGLLRSTPSTRWSAGSSATATTSATSPASTPTAAGRDPRPQGLPVGRARRVLVGRAARERRGRPRRGRQPRLLQRQRDLLEDPLGEQHRRLRHRPPHAGLLQGDPRQRQDRPHVHLDRDVARPAPVQPRGPEARRTRSPARSSRSTAAPTAIKVPAAEGKMRLWRNTQRRLASRPARRRRSPTAPSATSGTRTSTTAPAPPASFDLSSTTVDVPQQTPGLRLDLWPGHRDPQPDRCTALRAAPWSSAPARSSGRGASTAITTAAAQHARSAHAAGDREPARRHGRPAGHAAGRPRPRHRLDRHDCARLTDRVAARRRQRRRAGRRPRSPAPPPTAAADGGRSAASRSRSTGAPPGTRRQGRGSWTYTWTPGAAGSADDQDPRRRRQRQPREPRAPG